MLLFVVAVLLKLLEFNHIRGLTLRNINPVIDRLDKFILSKNEIVPAVVG